MAGVDWKLIIPNDFAELCQMTHRRGFELGRSAQVKSRLSENWVMTTSGADCIKKTKSTIATRTKLWLSGRLKRWHK
jgi:hypothetical protein